jgi:hypothetical protein
MIAVASRPESDGRDSRLTTSVLIGLVCLLIYNANGRAITAGDTYPARYLPFAIVKYQTIFLNPVAKVAAQGRGDGAFWMLPRPDGRIISMYPIVVPVLIAPLYVPVAAYLHLKGWTDGRMDHLARIMEKLSASLIASLSASLLYLLLRRRATSSIALLLTVAYAFGTTTWVISSQALWQHGMGAFLVIAALLCLTRASTAASAIAAGLLCGLIAANRPPDALLAAALGLYGLLWAHRRNRLLFVAAAALPLAIVLLYNVAVAGNVLGGYGLIGKAAFFNHKLLPGAVGLLFSPTRGLFVFSPFLLFLGLAVRSFPRSREERFLTVAMFVAVVLQVSLYAKADWRGGLSWGPRYMTDLLPFLIWMLVPVVSALRGVARVAFGMAVGAAIVIEAIGAFCYSPSFDLPIFAADRGWTFHEMRGSWQWRNTPILTSLRQGLAPAEFVTEIQGTFDAIEVGGRPTSVITAGQEVAAIGWTLVGHATPWQVAIAIDGRPPASTGVFFDRPDVRNALHEQRPAGWRIPIDTKGMSAGEHSVTAFVWTAAKSEGYYFQERKLTVRTAATGGDGLLTDAADDDLGEKARTATARIREHHHEQGYWLTAFTSTASFHDARPEMNTFLTALLVDLLHPIAGASGLGDNLQRARRHLTAQIESGGLVRYHGRPDGPGIGTLGCAITPDTDDTALVWRLAPAPDRARLTEALATIGRYRTSEGLYQSWLAPREAYQCLDPGSDPNPTDIAIQMHLMLLLAEVRPAAGRTLCEALRPVVDEDRVWVYYRKAPLIPILRLPDVQRAGCKLDLPESRMHTDVSNQEIWVSVARLLAARSTREGSSPDVALTRAVLRELARDDFALIRTNPPLFYHNDLTATVPRYYWSEDLGYALWLRLHDRYEHYGEPRVGR